MTPSPPGPDSALRALFHHELHDGDIDAETIGRIHRGDIDDWITAVARAGWFTRTDIAAIEQGWRADPRTLLDTLLTGADDVTAAQCRNIWAAYDTHVSVGTTTAYPAAESVRVVPAPDPAGKHPRHRHRGNHEDHARPPRHPGADDTHHPGGPRPVTGPPAESPASTALSPDSPTRG